MFNLPQNMAQSMGQRANPGQQQRVNNWGPQQANPHADAMRRMTQQQHNQAMPGQQLSRESLMAQQQNPTWGQGSQGGEFGGAKNALRGFMQQQGSQQQQGGGIFAGMPWPMINQLGGAFRRGGVF